METFNGNVCRACLAQNELLDSIFKISYGSDTNIRMAEIINILISSSVHIRENDGYSMKICVCCSEKLLEFYRFKLNIERNQEFLKLGLRNVRENEQPFQEKQLDVDVNKLDSIKREVEEMIINEFEEEKYYVLCESDEDKEMQEEMVVKKEENNFKDEIKNEVTIDDNEVKQEDRSFENDNDPLEMTLEYSPYDIQPDESTCGDDISQALEASKVAMNDLQPTTSKIYRSAYDKLIAWCNRKKVKNFSENVLLTYFADAAIKMNWKGSTMWSQYSMVKTLLHIKNGIDISKYENLRAYLKKQNQGHIPKKSRVLSKGQFNKFLNEASDEKFLDLKIVLLIGVSGGCRCDELVKLRIDDVEDLGRSLHIKILDSKTKRTRSFTVIGEHYLSIYRRYIALRPKDMAENRFFIKYLNGKCYRQVMGIHKIGNVCRNVASFLKLANPNEYTGHCLRRTSASLLADGGGGIVTVLHEGFKPATVAEELKKKFVVQKTLNPETMLPIPPLVLINPIRRNNGSENRVIMDSSGIKTFISKDANPSCASPSSLNIKNEKISNCTYNSNFVDKNK